MILSTLMAAAITVGTLQADNGPTPPTNPVEEQAGLVTYTLLLCRADLPPTVWDAWLPLAFDLGIDYRRIDLMREHIARKPLTFELNETVCLDLVEEQYEKLKSLQEQGA